MKTGLHIRFVRAERLFLCGAAAAALLSVFLIWLSPQALASAYRFAVFACLGPSLGSLLFLLIHRLTGGQWGDALRPFFVAGLHLLPWIWLLALPLFFFAGKPAGTSSWLDYSGATMMAVRSGFYTLFFFILARHVTGAAPTDSRRWLDPAGLIGTVFLLHLLAEDWIAALEPRWGSTGFPLVWMAGLAVSGLAGAILAAIVFSRHGAPENDRNQRPPGIDWGSLLLATTMFWCYVAFAQFLIIWAGNLPDEISWFVRRQGGWRIVAAVLGVVHFLLPMFVLLSRPAKRSGLMLGSIAALLLGAQWLYTAWLILPEFPGGGAPAGVLSLTLLGAMGGLFVTRYLAETRRQLEEA